jgi:hypothetical protein
MQPFQRHIKINFDHMRYLYQKGERALPGTLKPGNIVSYPPPTLNVASLTTSPLPFVFSLSLSLSLSNQSGILKALRTFRL